MESKQSLSKGPYSVLFRIATFLPPSANFRLKHVSRNFADVVERLTCNWIVPFIYCHQHKKVCHVGLFRFADLKVVVSKPLNAPSITIRTGKSYYKEVNEDEVYEVIQKMLHFDEGTLNGVAKCCPMPQPVMLLCDSVPLARTFESVIISKVRFAAPIDIDQYFHNEVESQETKSRGGEEEVEEEGAVADYKTDMVYPTVWTKLLLPEDRAASLDTAEESRKLAKPLTPNLVRKSIMESVFSVLPEALPHFSGSRSSAFVSSQLQQQHEQQPLYILAKSGRDAASICGRRHFAVLFSKHVKEDQEIHELQRNDKRSVNLSSPPETFDSLAASSLPYTSLQLYRKAAGLRTSPSLCKVLFDLEKINDSENQPSPLILNAGFPIFKREDALRRGSWRSTWSKRMFLLERDPRNTSPDRRNIPSWFPPEITNINMIQFVAKPLSRFFKPTDRLLVGESEEGHPVEIAYADLDQYMTNVAFQRTQDIAFPGQVFLMRKFKSNVCRNLHSNSASQHPCISGEIFNQMVSCWLVNTKDFSAKRMFLADDVSLGTVFAEELYFPNTLLKDLMKMVDEERNEKHEKSDDDDGDQKQQRQQQQQVGRRTNKQRSLNPRLTTPWILIGETGTFSDEHVEPEDLHVWVHLFMGTKLWFIERKQFVADDNNDADADRHQRQHQSSEKEEDKTQWDIFLQESNQTVVVPPKLRHFVLNITSTFAIARNFQG